MFNIIVAHDKNRGIAKNGLLPWPQNKTDMKHFMDITTKTVDLNKYNAVIMGRKTWDSIYEKYKPLKNRINVVLRREGSEPIPTTEDDPIYTFYNLDRALSVLASTPFVESIFVIGGQEIYEMAINDPRCIKIYVTEFKENFGPCDRFFPPIPAWFIQTSDRHESILLEFKTYETL